MIIPSSDVNVLSARSHWPASNEPAAAVVDGAALVDGAAVEVVGEAVVSVVSSPQATRVNATATRRTRRDLVDVSIGAN
jgi:hypothetical protein